jgi:hypothetical protein
LAEYSHLEDVAAAHMLEQPLVQCKKQEAIDTVKSCLGRDGVAASGGLSTYSFEYWTRDMCFSYEALASLGFHEQIDNHFSKLLALVKGGRVPTLYFGYPRRLSSSAKFTDEIDNELLILDLMKRLGRLDRYEEVWRYVESNLDNDGLIYGRDWRDGMRTYRNKATFHNQVLLYKLSPAGMKENLKERVEDAFWQSEKGYYADWVDKKGDRSEHLDVLGHALAILDDFVPESRIDVVRSSFKLAETEYGYANISPPYPRSECGWWRLVPGNIYQNGGVWGLVQGHMVLALLHLNLVDEATRQFWKMTRWEGLREWYDPETGSPKGSRSQLWTAALWLRCYDRLSERYGQRDLTDARSR